MSGQVALESVFTAIVAIISVFAGGYAVLLRFSFETYEKATQKRFADLEKDSEEDEKELKKEVKDLTTKNHALEIKTIELQGNVRLLETNHGRSNTELDSIRENMVVKSEWESRQGRVEHQIDEILKELRSRYGRSASSGGAYQAVTGVEIKR